MLTFKSTITLVTLVLSMVSATEHPADKLVYLDINTIFDRQFDVVWAFGNPVAKGSVSLNFSNGAESNSFSMSGDCDFNGTYTLGRNSVMDWNWEGGYTSCTESNVQNSIDHWSSNRSANEAQQYILYATAFGSSWCMIGDKDHQGNVIMPLVGQHLLSHPKFLNEEFQNYVDKYGSST